MGILDKLKSFLTPPPDVVSLYLVCNRCGEKLKLRIHMNSEVSQADNGKTFFCQKEALSTKCFQRIPIRVEFDSRRRMVRKEIEGGRFITQAEFESTEK